VRDALIVPALDLRRGAKAKRATTKTAKTTKRKTA